MKCPRCGRELCEQTVGGVSLDICNGGCGGVWFDHFELNRLLSADKTELDQLKVSRTPSVKTDTGRLRCPKCIEVIMQNHPYPGHVEISIDECVRCGGVWLDSGEFEQIRNVAHNDLPTSISGIPRREAPTTTGAYFSRKLYGRGLTSSTLGNMSGDPVGDLTDALTSHPEKATPWKTWGLGIFVAGMLVLGGIRAVLNSETVIYTRSGALHLTGLLAVSYRLIWMFAGLLLHFYFFWGTKENLERYAIPATAVSLGLLIISGLIFLWQCFMYLSGAM
jgi:uncharacterized protein